jgi:hypothetical protein
VRDTLSTPKSKALSCKMDKHRHSVFAVRRTKKEARPYPIPLAVGRICKPRKAQPKLIKSEYEDPFEQTMPRKALYQSRTGKADHIGLVTAPRSVLQSPESRVAARLIASVDWLGFRHYWLGTIPGMIGYHRLIDAAAVTLVLGQQCVARGNAGSRDLEVVRRAYGNVSRLLRSSDIDANVQFLAKALTGVFDSTMASYMKEWDSHQNWGQLSNLISSWPATVDMTDASKMIVCSAHGKHTEKPGSVGPDSHL